MLQLKLVRKKKTWERKETASFGLEHGESYYLNLETNETQWERPEAYLSDSELNPDPELDQPTYNLLSKNLNNFSTAVEEFNPSTETPAFNREQLEEIWDSVNYVQNSKGWLKDSAKAEWTSVFVKSNDYNAFRALYSSWMLHTETPEGSESSQGSKRVGSLVVCIIATILQFLDDPKVSSHSSVDIDPIQFKASFFHFLVDESWGVTYKTFFHRVSVEFLAMLKPLNSSNEGEEAQNPSKASPKGEVGFFPLRQILWTCYAVFSFGPICDIASFIENYTLESGKTFFPGILENSRTFEKEEEGFVLVLFCLLKVIESSREEEFLEAVKVLCAICAHSPAINLITVNAKSYEKEKNIPKVLVHLLGSQPQLKDASNSFTEGLFHFLNRTQNSSQELSPQNSVLLFQLLTTLKLFLANDLQPKLTVLEAFFSVQDVNLFVDIACVEVSNLDPGSQYRVEFLEVLRLVMRGKAWKRDRYKRKEIERVVERLVQPSEALLNEAREMARNIMEEFQVVFDQED